MTKCHYCGKIIRELPFRCHRCGEQFCTKHRMPERHKCTELKPNKGGPWFGPLDYPTRGGRGVSSSGDDIIYGHYPSDTQENRNHIEVEEAKRSSKWLVLATLTIMALLFVSVYYGNIVSFVSDYLPKENKTNDFKEWQIPIQTKEEAKPPVAENYSKTPKQVYLKYNIGSISGRVNMTVYKELNDHLASLPRTFYCDPVCPSEAEMEMRYINNIRQNEELDKLVTKIQSITNDTDLQGKIAISIVQRMDYDWDGFTTGNLTNRYPYEVIYDGRGVCGEKSRLLAYLLKELGFKVALFSYERESHMVVGVGCPEKNEYKNTGYCFVEATAPARIGAYNYYYVGVGKITSDPLVIPISDGISLKNTNYFN